MSESIDINVYSQTTIPNAMAELMDNHNKMEQISAYCKSLYANGDAAQAYEQTQGYAKNALLNVAYHIQTVGTHITSLLQLQTNEMEKLNIEIQTLTQRVRMIHDSTGTNVFSNQDAAKPYKSSLKNRKVDTEATKAPVKYVHKPISYGISASDINQNGVPPPLNHSNSSANLTSSSGHLAASSTSNSSTPSYQSPSYSSQPTISSGTPPPIQKQPPRVGNAPPPPSLSVPAAPPPPVMNVPPPPPTSQRPSSVNNNAPSNDFPPPPPPSSSSSGGDLPPPPSFGLPPPPTLGDDFPPPPPPPVGSYDFPPPPARPQSQFYDHNDFPPPPPPM
ncbi:component of SCAR regulatory complex [Dictyostelium discoideum AX4]|uniref:Abl interactor homolog n=1 Tax=Dictyostelium discoideum TaxID=44689 RepID=ABIA_DICDI|nr:component of SCAR regulatory complex [Dictyostelium discoideum AX4]Q55FT9.1 RecName: Full=Abl interactor homolog [Dictyostelium discoideum]EAL73431.1 component of SCAR regulatory complex [Dictyostelium discoideum AX4]|eukprot:XP_647444.1 component of SCAR regulatory complex [Dictyostelium discoideum AX4]